MPRHPYRRAAHGLGVRREQHESVHGHGLRGDRVLTTSRLAELIPDVSKATVYRHVDALAAGRVLEVADERRVRGAVERRYRLSPVLFPGEPGPDGGAAPE
ncbi:helix-turn-helix domain-containing protein [Actinomadura logoneensis]|uniref:hypothetical protein n=1 Tax=Actinomadura logoneensis TaxID=2293572 RepID=UPI0018F20C01|nr:hypothetical protein [Actinomadura logoneensis]